MNDAYAAGILDGEGCLTVGLNKRVMTYDSRIYVGMTEKAIGVLRQLKMKFGGSLKKTRNATAKWESAWMWTISGKNALPMIQSVLPHMILKQSQARLLLRLENLKADAREDGPGWTEEMRKEGAAIRASVMELNRKGPGEERKPPVPGALFVRDVDGFLMSKKNPDLFDDSTWQPWSGRWGNAAITEPGGYWTLATSECPSDEDGYSACSLADILESNVAAKYSLSATACRVILRRAAKRGKRLPEHLEAALRAVAGPTTPTA